MLRLDLHTHSQYSRDSAIDVDVLLRTALRRGVHGVCIADHNSLGGSARARELAAGLDLLVIRGMEISSAEGHILAYGIDEEVPRDLSAADTVARIQDLGGFAVAAHPYRFWSGLGEPATRGTPFEGVEVLNGRSVAGHNAQAEGLAQTLRLPATGGSDAHRLDDVGRALVLLPDGIEGEEAVLEALRRGEGRTAGVSRSGGRTLRYVGKAVGEWMLRGFRRI